MVYTCVFVCVCTHNCNKASTQEAKEINYFFRDEIYLYNVSINTRRGLIIFNMPQTVYHIPYGLASFYKHFPYGREESF